MHLVPAERAHRRIIDGEKVCQAIEGLGDPTVVQTWARRFSVLADPTRLRLLICIHAAELISVSDLAVAADLNEDTVSQTLRFLRANQTVVTERDGRVIRYRLADDVIQELLERVGLSISD
jgi:DNA-binding transcriptional ArsR family regulator